MVTTLPLTRLSPFFLPRQHDEARCRMRFVLDILFQYVETVDFRRQPRGDCGAGDVLGFRDFARRPAVSAATTGLSFSSRMMLRHWPSAITWLCTVLMVFRRRALWRHQLIADRQKPFGDDVQARGRHQMMDVGDAAGDRILDRDHAEIDVAGVQARKSNPRRSGRASARDPDRLRGRRDANSRPARPGK